MQLAELGGHRVAILGTGREGQAAWRYLRATYPGMELVLYDEAEPDAAFREQLTPLDRLVVGSFDQARFDSFELLLRSPGISPYRPGLAAARAAGVRVTSPGSLWFATHPHAKTVCISGTKGKSTTSALLAHMLRYCGFRVQLAGNIGRPLLDCDDQDVDWWVIELSSYQLADLQASPEISVLLNLSAEHLDWHGGEARYQQDKFRLIELSSGQPVIANAADPVLREALKDYPAAHWFNASRGIRVAGKRWCDGETDIGFEAPVSLPGAHNLSNAAAALTVLRVIGLDTVQGAQAMATFRALPHRLQQVGERDGIRYINDSISSTPVATAAALEALAGQKVILIAGGLDRGVDWTPYMSPITRYAPLAVITVPDNGPRIISSMKGAGFEPEMGLYQLGDLAGAVALARKLAPAGGVVLLSPGAPSFPRFRNFRDRGCQFARLCGFEADDREPA